MTLLLAAAMPVRFITSVPVVGSISILDVVLLTVAMTLFIDLALRPLDLGLPDLFFFLSIPFVVAVVSIVWSQDRNATAATSLVYIEGLIAYLFVVRELEGLPSERVIRYVKRYAYLLIIPGILLLLRVPGFEPQVPELSKTSGDYISFYSRLSHPILGRSNNLATLLAFLAPILLYWGHTRHDRRATVAGFVTILALAMTLSRGTLVAFVLAGVVYAILFRHPRRVGVPVRRVGGKVALALILGAAAVGAFYSINPETNEFLVGRLSLDNVHSREALISAAVSKIQSRPVLGYGAGVIPDAEPALAITVHNTFLQQMLAYGLLLGTVVGLALCGFAAAFLARRRVTPIAGALGYAVMVQLIAFLSQASFEGTVIPVLLYMSIGLAVGLLRAVEAESPDRGWDGAPSHAVQTQLPKIAGRGQPRQAGR